MMIMTEKKTTYKYEYLYCLLSDINTWKLFVKIRSTGSFVKVLCFTDIQINISITRNYRSSWCQEIILVRVEKKTKAHHM